MRTIYITGILGLQREMRILGLQQVMSTVYTTGILGLQQVMRTVYTTGILGLQQVMRTVQYTQREYWV